MNSDQQRSSSNFRSFDTQVGFVLRDLQLWAILLPALLLIGIVIEFLPPVGAAALTAVIGLLAGYVIQPIDNFPISGGPGTLERIYEKTVMPGIVGILVVQGSDVFARLWLMPWYWLFWYHSIRETPSRWLLMCGVAWDWFGFLVCGVLLAVIAGRRATFAAMIGIAIYLPLELTDLFTGMLSQKSFALFLSIGKILSAGTDNVDFESARESVAWGLVFRALLLILSARVASFWLVSQRASTKIISDAT